MKSYFFLALFFFLYESQSAFAQANFPLAKPFVTFSPKASRELFGIGNPRKILNCPILMAQQWAYSNAQVVSFCNDAQTSCVRLGLLEQKLKNPVGFDMEKLKKDYFLTVNDVQLKLRGCQLAIESTVTGSSSVVEGAGFSNY